MLLILARCRVCPLAAVISWQAGYSSVGRASDCRILQQSDGPWFDSGWPDFWRRSSQDRLRYTPIAIAMSVRHDRIVFDTCRAER